MSGPVSRPWPFLFIPRPPLSVGVELVSLPEAVGILGSQLRPGVWPDRPMSWREHWPAPREWFAREPLESDEDYRDRTGRAQPPDDDTPLRQLQKQLTGLLALGFVRAVDERGEPVPRTTWGAVASHGDVIPRLGPETREKVYRASRIVPDDQAEEAFVYLVLNDVEAVGPHEIGEAEKAIRNVGGRPRTSWKPTLLNDVKLLEGCEEHPLRNVDGSFKEIREIVAVLVEPPIKLTGRFEGPCADASGREYVDIYDAESGIRLGRIPPSLDSISRALKPLRLK